ncbi:hypothetical protein SH668x_003548 [Planctomicrobium sp. SH668]|uniref:hypothetical protein n=1 Tax=Planctomicrobium sp. SH668 TaxID=3448126 RepID=UPI003F5B8B8B
MELEHSKLEQLLVHMELHKLEQLQLEHMVLHKLEQLLLVHMELHKLEQLQLEHKLRHMEHRKLGRLELHKQQLVHSMLQLVLHMCRHGDGTVRH